MPDKPKPPAAQTAVQKESRAAATIPQYPASATSTAPTKEIVGGRTRAWSSSMQVLELSDRQEGVISPQFCPDVLQILIQRSRIDAGLTALARVIQFGVPLHQGDPGAHKL